MHVPELSSKEKMVIGALTQRVDCDIKRSRAAMRFLVLKFSGELDPPPSSGTFFAASLNDNGHLS
jgi:hypothetical protein